jgi:hypothetical protein
MGFATAKDLQDELLELDLEQQISLHFQVNCYPPIPQQMLSTAIEAIDNAYEGEWKKMIRLPDGVTFRGYDEISTTNVIDSYRLQAWLPEDEED